MNVPLIPAFLLLITGLLPLPQKRVETEEDYFKKWVDQDVAYIITPDEREIYLNLQTGEEREKFIEQFWRRRDPDPDTSYNEYKEEHYRRLAYVRDHYSTGMPGWKTDRGRVYIIQGPPDSLESHAPGETYYRPRSEGGGVTTTFGFEVWHYRHIEGLGSNVSVEFVDKSMSGHYTLAMDEMEKDMLLYVPGIGHTAAEQFNPSLRSERLGTRFMANDVAQRSANPMRSFSAENFTFQRLQRLAKLQRAPDIRYKDLEAVVRTQVYYNDIPFQVRVDPIRVTSDEYLVPVTFYFDRSNLGYKRSGPILGAQLNVYGRIENMTRTIVYAFDDDVNAYFNEDQMRFVGKRSVYQRNIPLKPGRYKLTAVVKDTVTGKMGTLERGIIVPRFEEGKGLQMSEIILADRIHPSSREEFITDPFVLATVKVYPNAANRFVKGQPLGFYFEVYDAELDAQSGDPSLKVDLRLEREGVVIETPFRDLESRLHPYGDRLFMGSLMGTEALAPGSYTLTMTVRDRIAGTVASKSAQFVLLVPESTENRTSPSLIP